MGKTILPKGQVITLLTSYCGDDNRECTDRRPCNECVDMCNTFELQEAVEADHKGQVDKDV